MSKKPYQSLSVFNMRGLLVSFLSIYLLVFSGLVQSANVFFQAPQNGGDGVDSYTPEEFADNFSFNSKEKITGIQWWASFIDETTANNADDVFDIRFYDDNSGLPGVILNSFLGVTASRSTTSLLDIASEPVFRFSVPFLSPLYFMANETYYVSIEHVDENDQYFWLESDSSGSYYNQNVRDNIPWQEITVVDNILVNNLSLKLIPEPNSLILFTVAFFGLAFFRRSISV